MNNINRVLVKSQAKAIIRDKVFILFIISAVVLILTNGISVSMNIKNSYDKYQNKNNYDYNDYSDLDDYSDYYDYFNQFSDGGSSDNPIDNFGSQMPQSYKSDIAKSNTASIFGSGYATSMIGVIGVIFSPMFVTLMGFYLALVRRNPEEEIKLGTELGGLFKKSFDATFLKKLVIYVLRELFIILLCILFIIPGIIYNYSTYFAFQLMNEYPNLKPTEAFKLSRKIVRGNRSELFWLDFSFIGWFFLCAITCGIASIYVIPYYLTTQALYYENFRLRALAEGRVNEDDFLSADELSRKYNFQGSQGSYCNPNVNNQYNNNQGTYYAPNTDRQSNYTQNSQPSQNYYYQPVQDEEKTDAPPTQEANYSYAQPQNDVQQNNSQQGEYYNPSPFADETADNTDDNIE